jgi:uncharacterized membrane protein
VNFQLIPDADREMGPTKKESIGWPLYSSARCDIINPISRGHGIGPACFGVKEESMALIQKIIHALLVVQPPHPLFVHFPIALISTALFFLLLAVWKKSDLLEKIAFANLCLAAVSIVVAAFFGIRDNLVIFQGTAPNHLAKIIIATILFLVTGVTVLLRWKNPDLFHGRFKGLYLAVHFVLFILVAVQGFLGGIIVYGF